MTRMATLVIVGNIPQALEAVLAHNILNAKSVVQDPDGVRVDSVNWTTQITRVTLDGELYNKAIAAWLNEPTTRPLQPGALLRARWS